MLVESRRWRRVVVAVLAVGCTVNDDPPREHGSGTDSSAEGETSGSASSVATAMSSSSAGTEANSDTSDAPGTSSSVDDGGDASTHADSTGDGGGTGEPVGCYDYGAFVPSTVGFRADVLPIFATWCSPCHMDADNSVYFGQGGTTEAEAVAIYDKLLHGVPKQAPALAFVAPGDPLRSYMLAKVEYPNPGGTCSEVQCSEPGCELPAPPAGPLSETDKAVLRSWVMNGALDD